MKLLMMYIRQRRKGLIAGIVFSCIFTVSFILYELPVKAVMYPAVLCLCLCIVFAILDFRRAKKKHDMLSAISDIADVREENLPLCLGLDDEDYQKVLYMVKEKHGELVTKYQQSYADMVEYYTVWAHQIKTPIASMRLTLQNEDSALSRQLTNDLFRTEQYVEMVLTFLRLNSESTDYIIREYDLDEIIRQSVKKFAGEFISRKISLSYEPINYTVLTDEKWLSFVIEQVLSNALKYTPSGSIFITMEDEGRLCIRDTGIGIDAQDLPRIFEHGYTGYNGRLDKKASGIGLYLCKRICERLGHGIEARSTVSEGTSIIIDLSHIDLGVE